MTVHVLILHCSVFVSLHIIIFSAKQRELERGCVVGDISNVSRATVTLLIAVYLDEKLSGLARELGSWGAGGAVADVVGRM